MYQYYSPEKIQASIYACEEILRGGKSTPNWKAIETLSTIINDKDEAESLYLHAFAYWYTQEHEKHFEKEINAIKLDLETEKKESLHLQSDTINSDRINTLNSAIAGCERILSSGTDEASWSALAPILLFINNIEIKEALCTYAFGYWFTDEKRKLFEEEIRNTQTNLENTYRCPSPLSQHYATLLNESKKCDENAFSSSKEDVCYNSWTNLAN